jgi:hypothetical protein
LREQARARETIRGGREEAQVYKRIKQSERVIADTYRDTLHDAVEGLLNLQLHLLTQHGTVPIALNMNEELRINLAVRRLVHWDPGLVAACRTTAKGVDRQSSCEHDGRQRGR